MYNIKIHIYVNIHISAIKRYTHKNLKSVWYLEDKLDVFRFKYLFQRQEKDKIGLPNDFPYEWFLGGIVCLLFFWFPLRLVLEATVCLSVF
jgi:hypothetical protein